LLSRSNGAINIMKILLHDSASGIGGSKITCIESALALTRRGHEVKITGNPEQSILFQQPEVLSRLVDPGLTLSHYEWADIVLVHFPASHESLKISKLIDTPRVYFLCNPDSPRILGLRDAALLIFNSYWLMSGTDFDRAKIKGDTMVIYPPVYPEKFKTTRGGGILLVSPIIEKGIRLFIEIAKKLPGREFTIARGATWGTPELEDLPDNIRVIERVADAREIYSQARLVLMPSRTGKWAKWTWVEGYGRVAIEAACSGIPTIASRESAGLRECLGEGGMFCCQDDPGEWVEMILKLDDKKFYREKSRYAFRLARERRPDKQIDELERKLVTICNRV
jgi:glycosyltransferase involved in cell wall biosynthesis